MLSALSLIRGPALIALPKIVLGGPGIWARRSTVWIEIRLGSRDHTAIFAHPEHVEPLRRAAGLTLKHPMPSFEPGDHAFDRALGPKRFVAAHAAEWLLLLEHPRMCCGGAEIQLRHQRDHLFR